MEDGLREVAAGNERLEDRRQERADGQRDDVVREPRDAIEGGLKIGARQERRLAEGVRDGARVAHRDGLVAQKPRAHAAPVGQEVVALRHNRAVGRRLGRVELFIVRARGQRRALRVGNPKV